MGLAEVAQWFFIGVALAVAIKVLIQPIVREKALNRAFKTLEHEVSEQWEKVESHLGRISRLKRDIKKHSGNKDGFDTERPGNAPEVPPIVTRSSLLAEHRRKTNHG